MDKSNTPAFHSFCARHSRKTCVAFGCNNVACPENRAKGITFHLFPMSDPERVKVWEYAMNRQDFKATKNSLVCSEHFIHECFNRTGCTVRLLDRAIPTIFNLSENPRTRKKKRNPSVERLAITDVIPTIFDLPPLVPKKYSKPKNLHQTRSPMEAVESYRNDHSSPPAIPENCFVESAIEEDHSSPMDRLEAAEAVVEESYINRTDQSSQMDGIEAIEGCAAVAEESQRYNTSLPPMDRPATPEVLLTESAEKDHSYAVDRPATPETDSAAEEECQRPLIRLPLMAVQWGHSNTSERPRKIGVKKSIDPALVRSRKQFKAAQQKIRRLKKKVETLENENHQLKKRDLEQQVEETISDSFRGPAFELVMRCIKNIKVNQQGLPYPKELCTFAQTLHSHSPLAYSYVRDTFNLCLPHWRTMQRKIAKQTKKKKVPTATLR